MIFGPEIGRIGDLHKLLETEHCYHNVSDTDSPYVQNSGQFITEYPPICTRDPMLARVDHISGRIN